MSYLTPMIILLLIPIASASFLINNGSSVTETTLIPINITGEETYTFIVDGNALTLDNTITTIEINNTKGYHNITTPNTLTLLIYDTTPPEITITNISSTSYHYTQLPIPNLTVSDDNSLVFTSQTPINSTPGNHIFSVTATDIASRSTTKTINYTVIANTTVNLTKDSTLLLPLMNSTLYFTSNNPVNLSISLPAGFTTQQPTYTNITSLNFTIKSGISPLDSFVPVSVSYSDNYGTSGIIPLQYWLVGNKTVFYLSYDLDMDSKISKKEAMNATKVYYIVTSISSDRIKEMIRTYQNNQSYIN